MRRARTPGTLAAAVLFALASPHVRAAAIFTVTNTNDGGAGSFRQAILDANASPGGDVIQFAIPAPGVQTILTFSPLYVTENVLIDGYSQPGSAWNTHPLGDNAVILIELFGQGTDGLVVTGGSTVIQGLSLYGFQTAFALSGAFGVLIQGNFIGVSAGGQASGNVTGVSIIGTYGLDRIGDNYPAARNLISGNATGILLSGGGQKKIFGNLIGTTATGTIAEPNGIGVRVIDSLDNLIGEYPDGGNVISGNTTHGVHLTGGSGNAVVWNAIGADAATTAALGNGGDGVHVDGSIESLNLYFNTICGNGGDGIELAYTTPNPAATNVVSSNYIGTQFPNFLTDLGNGGAGVRVESGAALQIEGNAIAFNHVGVWRVAPNVNDTVRIHQNGIYENRGLGIVLGPAEEIVPNVPLSPFNFPLIKSAVTGGGNVTIDGVYSGPENTEITLEFFAEYPDCPARYPHDFLEGFRYVGAHTLVTDAGGNAAFNVSFPEPGWPNPVLTATATARVVLIPLQGSAVETFQTSEFSQRLPFSVSPASGAAAGGEPITIHGTNFDQAASVTIGGATPPNLVVADDSNITADSPAFPGGFAADIVVTNPDGTHGTLVRGWIADFLDVPPGHPFHDYVLALVRESVASGVGGGYYGVATDTLRQQMAVFLLRARWGPCLTAPTSCQGIFSDVPCSSPFAPWIEELYDDGITGGCGPGIFCPTSPVLRQQMAVFLLKAKYGESYVPPPCVGLFGDVPCPSTFADWIEQLSRENITGGCGGGNYCPTGSTTRGQMAVFLVKTFNLQ